MNYYPFHLGDYISDTAHLNIYEDLAYRRLIDLYYLKESPIENNIEKIVKRIRMPQCDGDIQSVIDEYFTIIDGFIHHARCDKELAKYHAKADSARINGRKGGRPNKPKITQPVNLANPEESGSKANQEPRTNTNNQEPVKKKVTKKFKPPLLEDLLIYISANLYQVNAESFLNFYESKGWMVGRNNMKDWKAAVRQWHSRNKEKTNEENRRPSTPKAKQYSDTLDEIARRDIEENGFASTLDN